MNIFIAIPVPAVSNFPGAAVDVSVLAEKKTFVVKGPNPPRGRILIEISGDGGTSFSPLVILDPVGDPGPKNISATAQLVRATRLEGSGAVDLDVGAQQATNTFIALGLAAVDVSTLGPSKTLIVGSYRGLTVVEGSQDGITFSPVVGLNTSGPDVIGIDGDFKEMKIRVASGSPPSSIIVAAGVPSENTNSFLSEEVTNATSDLVRGEVVRMAGDDSVTRSQADSAANAQGTIGVAMEAILSGDIGSVVTEGKALALLEAGLVGVTAGQTLWVSPNVPGRATNVKPSGVGEVELCVGVIKDASSYVVDETVIADIDVDCEPAVAGLVASIQCGKVTFAGETTKAVLFPVSFPVGVEPAVTLTPVDESNVNVTPNLDAAAVNTGFTIRMSAAYTGTVYWIACTD